MDQSESRIVTFHSDDVKKTQKPGTEFNGVASAGLQAAGFRDFCKRGDLGIFASVGIWGIWARGELGILRARVKKIEFFLGFFNK